MASLYKKQVMVTNPRTRERVKAKSKKWWGRYRDVNGRRKRVPLSVDKMAAQAMLNQIVRRVERTKAGLIDPTDGQRKRPLVQHIAEFEKHQANRGVNPRHTKGVISRIAKLLNARHWQLIGEITADGTLDFLGQLLRDGSSPQTYNHYLRAAKQFTRWLVREQRTSTDPLLDLAGLNVRADRRHDRRALSTEEFHRLVEAARKGKHVEGLPGPDRAMLYILAAWTGFRKSEISSLTRQSLRLDDDPPTATIEARHSKHRRKDTLVLHTELARQLREWLAAKPCQDPLQLLFPISKLVPRCPERRTHKMMERDLATARTNWLDEAETAEQRRDRVKTDFLCYRDHQGLFADFHSMRHLFITNLERAGISPKMAQTLARHSDIRLTLGVYTHIEIHDCTLAIQSLPAPPDGANVKVGHDHLLQATTPNGRRHYAIPWRSLG